jgi:hypothetical protein
MPACAIMADSRGVSAEDGWGGGTGFATSAPSATGAGGTTKDGSIEFGPDSGGDDPSQPYASLCAAGECTIGEDGCPDGAGGGEPVAMACELVPSEDGAMAACAPAGTFEEGEPCKSADHCAAGLGCAATATGGVCRSYCCGDVELCPASTYCDLQPMAEDAINMTPIPVCVPATKCELLNDDTCTEPLVCTIVRADGTTSCVAPGPGLLNDPCPCAAGYVCSKLDNQCKKLCKLGMEAMYCDGVGSCLNVGMGIPDGFGICSPANK